MPTQNLTKVYAPVVDNDLHHTYNQTLTQALEVKEKQFWKFRLLLNGNNCLSYYIIHNNLLYCFTFRRFLSVAESASGGIAVHCKGKCVLCYHIPNTEFYLH